MLLHGVQDPGNVGTVIRSAHAFGAGVALSKGCADLYNPKTVRATMGSLFHAPVSRELDSLEFLAQAHGAGFASVAAVPVGENVPRSLPDGRLVIVVGAEGAGLPQEVVDASQARVTMRRFTAGGILPRPFGAAESSPSNRSPLPPGMVLVKATDRVAGLSA